MTQYPSRLILASSSIYRKELLSRLHIPFETLAPHIDETALTDENPEHTCLRLAKEKAQEVARIAPGNLVIGSDQLATLNGLAIGKPGSHENAFRQLKTMRGQRVIFHTALCLLDDRGATPAVQLENVQTLVQFRDLPDHELDAYLRCERPYDVAGSAKIEALGISLIESVESRDPSALIGLPLIALTTMLRKVGFPFFA